MRTPRQYLSERYPWLNPTDSLGAIFVVALVIVVIWPRSRLVSDVVLISAIPGSIAAVLWSVTFWAKARVQIGRLRLRYKAVRRMAGLAALFCLSFAFLQQTSIYLSGPNMLRQKPFDASGLTQAYPDAGKWHGRMVVAIANLEGDDGNKLQGQLRDALTNLDPRLQITPIILDRTIAISNRPQGIAHLDALNTVTELRTDALIWGGLKGASGTSGHAIYLTRFGNDPQFNGVYLPADFKLPDLAPGDLCDVMRLVMATLRANELRSRMFQFGDALEPLIRRTRTIADDSRHIASWSADARARVNFILGVASTASGEQLKSQDSLNAAVSYFNRIQPDWTRESNPLDWADAQLSLAAALAQISNHNPEIKPVQTAVAALNNSLSVYQEKSDTVDSATAELALGRLYQQMSMHDAGPDSLRKAADYCRAAIKGFDIKFYDMSWAAAQTTLGSVLTSAADREGNVKGYDDAIAAFEQALQVYRKQSAPMLWADAQLQRSEALELRGQARSNADDLKRAVGITRQVLDGFPRSQDATRWGGAEAVLGNQLLALNDVQPDAKYPQEAVRAFRASLEVTSRDSNPIGWAVLKDALGDALQQLGVSTNESWCFEQAIQNLNEALEVLKPDRDPVQWARTKSDLGDALSSLGFRGSGVRYLKEAVDNYHQALTILTKDKLPGDWQKTQNNLNVALDALRQRGWTGS